MLTFNLGITSTVLIFVFTALIASGQPVKLLTGLPAVFLYQLLRFQLHQITRIVEDAAALAMGCFLLRAGHWIVTGDTSGSLASGRTVEIINQCIFYGLLVVVVIAGVQVLRGVHRLFRGTPDRALSRA